MNDLKFALRQLLKNPGFTAVAVLTLALGIGATTAIFTMINSVLLRPLPVEHPDQIVQVVSKSESERLDYVFSYPLFAQLRDGGRSLTGLFAAGGVGRKDRLQVPNGTNAETEFVRAQGVSGNFFDVLEVRAVVGRTLSAPDEQAGKPQAVAVISHSFWRRRFGGDPSIIGKAVNFDEVPFTIVGVAPSGFFGFQPGENPDLWWPLQMAPQIDHDPSGRRLKAGSSWLRLLGRLSGGAKRTQAKAELEVAFQRYQQEFAASRAAKWSDELRERFFSQHLELWPARTGWTGLRDQFRQPLLILIAASGLVLLIACANIASLLLARGASRRQEFSIRTALGAPRFRLVRQLLTESLLLAALGGGLGFLLARGGTRLLQSVMHLEGDSLSLSLSPDFRVMVFTTAVAMLTGLLFGLAPAIRGSRSDLTTAIKGSTGGVMSGLGKQRSLQALVVIQVALSSMLLVGAGLFVRTLQSLTGMDAGFDRDNVVLFNVDFPQAPDSARLRSFQTDVLARLESLPGVQTASLFNFGFLSGNYWTDAVVPDGYEARPGEDLECSGTMVGPGFFETFGIHPVLGRGLEPQDEWPASATNWFPKTAVINQAMARRYFNDANPVGRSFHFVHAPERKFEIVGVVPDARYRSLRAEAPPTMYLPYFHEDSGMTFALRTRTGARRIMTGIPGLVREVGRGVRVRDVRTMSDVVNDSVRRERMITQLSGCFGVFAIALACLGLYGVVSFAVTERRREIGLRIALGAQRRNVLSLVIAKGLKLALTGSAIGLVGGLIGTRLVASLLYGVTPTDPATFGSILFLIGLVAFLASGLPALRASRIDPMEALRNE